MMENKDIFRLEHILESIEKIEWLVRNLHSFENFETQWIEQDALIRNLEIIGEASAHISDELKKKYSDVLWKEMRGMRNFITHKYFGLELNEIWSTVINDIPLLRKQISEILLQINN